MIDFTTSFSTFHTFQIKEKYQFLNYQKWNCLFIFQTFLYKMHSRCLGIMGGHGNFASNFVVKLN
jgi:hypothetical protein